jgi:hypothetical protein
LVELGANINLKDRNKWTPLVYAVNYDNVSMVKTLLSLGVNMKKHGQGNRALIRAVSNNKDFDIVKSLIDAGADPNHIDNNHSTPLIYASLQSRQDIVKLLLAKGVDVNIQNENGMSPLMMAVTKDDDVIVRLLLDAGADTTLKNNNHQNAEDIARVWRRPENIEIIRNHRRVNESIRDFMTPKSKDELKSVLDKLPETQRLSKGISMGVYTEDDFKDLLKGLSPREYFVKSTIMELSKPTERMGLVDKIRTFIKPYKKVRIGDLLTVAPRVLMDKNETTYPLYKIIHKHVFFNRDDFYKFVKEYQLGTTAGVDIDSEIKSIYQTNSWMKINAVIVTNPKHNRYGQYDPKKTQHIIYAYGKTTGVFPYTKKELDEYNSL